MAFDLGIVSELFERAVAAYEQFKESHGLKRETAQKHATHEDGDKKISSPLKIAEFFFVGMLFLSIATYSVFSIALYLLEIGSELFKVMEPLLSRLDLILTALPIVNTVLESIFLAITLKEVATMFMELKHSPPPSNQTYVVLGMKIGRSALIAVSLGLIVATMLGAGPFAPAVLAAVMVGLVIARTVIKHYEKKLEEKIHAEHPHSQQNQHEVGKHTPEHDVKKERISEIAASPEDRNAITSRGSFEATELSSFKHEANPPAQLAMTSDSAAQPAPVRAPATSLSGSLDKPLVVEASPDNKHKL